MLPLKFLKKTRISVTSLYSLILHILILLIFSMVYYYSLDENDINYNSDSKIENNTHDKHNYTNIFYFSVVTHSTLGYGDIKPITPKAKRIISLHVFIVILLVAFFGSN